MNGTAAIHQAWNGDIVNVRNQVDNPEVFSYETCEEGVPVGTDLMCIPVTCAEPGHGDALHRLDPRAGERCAERACGTAIPSRTRAAREAFAELVKEEPSIDVDLNQLGDSGLEYRLDDADDRALWSQIWTEVKAT